MNDPISYGHFELEGWDLRLGASLSDWTTYNIGKYIGDYNHPNSRSPNKGKRETPWDADRIISGESDDT